MNLKLVSETKSSDGIVQKEYTGYGYRITVHDYRPLISSPALSMDCKIEPLYQNVDGEIAMYPNVTFLNGKCHANFKNGLELDSGNEEMWLRGIHNATALMREIEDNQKELFSFS